MILLLIPIVTSSCITGTKQTAKSTSGTSIQPDWYQSTDELVSDSLAYAKFETVLHSDSSKAIGIATKTAKHHLSTVLDEINEDIRTTLVEDQGLDALSSANFIIQLRRYRAFEDDFKVSNVVARETENGYQGFVKVEIAQKSFHSQMRTFLDRATTNTNRDAWMSKY